MRIKNMQGGQIAKAVDIFKVITPNKLIKALRLFFGKQDDDRYN